MSAPAVERPAAVEDFQHWFGGAAPTVDLGAVRVPPRWLWIPEHRYSSAAVEVAQFMELIGRPPDAEQLLALDCLLAENVDGTWAAGHAAIMESRQNGKTAAVLLPSAMYDLFVLNVETIVWTAHQVATADKTWKDLLELIEGVPELRRRVKGTLNSAGRHQLELTNGAVFQLLARSATAGRGFTKIDRIFFDEAQELKDSHLGALLPTQAIAENPQVRYAGSAGGLKSETWRAMRRKGRAGAEKGPAAGDATLAWIEWGAGGQGRCGLRDRCRHVPGTPGCQLDNPTRWQEANHTLRTELVPDGRYAVRTLMGFRSKMTPLEFSREILGWWEDPPAAASVDADRWSALQVAPDPDGGFPPVPADARKVFIVDVSPQGASACIVMAARMPSGRCRVEVVRYGEGTAWVVDECKRLKKTWRARIVLVEQSPAVIVHKDLERAHVRPYAMSPSEYAAACTIFMAQVAPTEPGKEPGVEHLGDEIFATAIQGGVLGDTGDGLIKWKRKDSGSDICAIVAASLGPWALDNVRGSANLVATGGGAR